MPTPSANDQNNADASTGDDEAPTRQDRAPAREPATEEQIAAVHIGGQVPLNGPIVLADYDPLWPQLFERERERIRAALGGRVLMLEHVGSTSVPGVAAKPLIDLLLVVPDSADEPSYVPALEAAGYMLRIREPEWYEHRMLKGPDTDINLHVFSPGCPEVERMLRFRDWLRANAADRQLYERTKRELAGRAWKYTQNYADAKTEVVEVILARARADEADEQRRISMSAPKLNAQHCVACRGDEPGVSDAEREEYSAQVPSWHIVAHEGIPHLTRTFHFDNFVHALAFTNAVGTLAEEQGHHPAILTEWGKVTVEWWTHKIRALHRNDFIMAARTDELFAPAPGARPERSETA